MYDKFKPGQVWLDTDGNRIQAHGGSILYQDGVYYWYGENKEHTDGVSDIWTWGVRCYSSTDLYNWKDEGLIIPPDLKNQNSPLSPKSQMDRPHIIYNENTKKFVCWLKIMSAGEDRGYMSVMTADDILGPYQMVTERLHPLNMEGGDFDLAAASDGKGYFYFERAHCEMICADLTDDYTNLTGYYSTHFPLPYPPYVREAPAHFIHDHKHYLMTSGTTGYFPNPSKFAIADTWHGPYTDLGDACIGDDTHTTFHSQASSVFKVQGKKNLYIACGDRWLPTEMNRHYEDYASTFEGFFNPEKRDPEQENLDDLVIANTAQADYVWLPIEFIDGVPKIRWHEEWTLDEFD